MVTDEQLETLLCELDADEANATAERPFPHSLSRATVAAVVTALHHQIDFASELRARIVSANGDSIACHRGCNSCCHELVMVAEPEAIVVARWLDDRPDEREAFLSAYSTWRRRVGDVPVQLRKLSHRGDHQGHLRLSVAQFRKAVLCAFNRDGQCSIYPVRPMVCRVAHALNTADHCRPDNYSTTRPTRVEFAPLEELVARARKIILAAHRASGGADNFPGALCDTVYRLLTTETESYEHAGESEMAQEMAGGRGE